MAAGDIVSVEVLGTTDYNGWAVKVRIEGWAGKTAVTEAFGLTAENEPGANTPYLTVLSEGYTNGVLGARARTCYLKEVCRKAYPDHASQNVADNLADLDVIIALFDPVFNDDKNGGAGTSGTDPTFTAPASGWLTAAGVTNAATAAGMAVLNSSALDYPKVIGQWEMLPFERVQADFVLAFGARATYGVDVVRFDATGDTSAANVNETVTSESSYMWSASGLYSSRHQTTVPLAGFTQGEHITCRARAYPLIGDADSMIDTNGVTFDARLHGAIKMTCDKTGALITYAFVSSTGNDTTGVASATEATARANPCLTIGQAIAKGAKVIKVMNEVGILGDDPAVRVTSQYFIKVIPDDGLSITLNLDGTAATMRDYKCERLLFEGFTIKTTQAGGYLQGDALNFVAFRDCTLNANAITLSAPLGYRSLLVSFFNCSGLDATRHRTTSFSTSVNNAFVMFGCASTSGGASSATFACVACFQNGSAWFFTAKPTTNTAPTWENVRFESNKVMNSTDGAWLNMGSVTVQSISTCGNLIEKASGTQTAMEFGISAPLENAILAHNTIAGERINIGYNDTGSTRLERRNYRQLGNSVEDWNHKGDNYVVSPNGARTGGWWVNYNVGSKHNHHETSGFPGDADGQDHTEGTGVYTNDKSIAGAGGGNGDYTPAIGSVLRNRLTERLMRYDQNGVEIRTDGTGAVGAIQLADSGRTAELNATLENATLSATGAVGITASTNATLENVTLDAQLVGEETRTAAVDATLEGPSLVSAVVVEIAAGVVVTLQNVTLSASAGEGSAQEPYIAGLLQKPLGASFRPQTFGAQFAT